MNNTTIPSFNCEVNEGTSFFTVKKNLTLTCPDFFAPEAQSFCSILEKANKVKIKVVLQDLPEEDGIGIRIDSALDLKEEEYRLDICPNSIQIGAGNACGAYRGLMTVCQMLMTEKKLSSLTVQDGPAYPWRGFMLDCVRNFFTLDYILRTLDLMALHKLNVFHWHLSDDQGWRFSVPKYPKLLEIGKQRRVSMCNESWDEFIEGFYSDEEIKKVVSYAAARHITVVPEVETPGHTLSLLAAYPELGCTGGPYKVDDRWGIYKDVLCAGKEEVFELLDAVFERVSELFPGPFIHMGGDECPRDRWKECPDCQKKMKELGLSNPDGLQSYMTERIVKIIGKYGKRAIGWDEVLEGTDIPKSVIIASWRGFEGGRKAAKMGHQVIMCPLTQGCYLDYRANTKKGEAGNLGVNTCKMTYSLDPSVPGTSEDAILGGQGNLWTEMVFSEPLADYMLFPRLCAIAETLWLSESNKNFESFKERLEPHWERLECFNVVRYRGPLE